MRVTGSGGREAGSITLGRRLGAPAKTMTRRILLLVVTAVAFTACGRQAPSLERASTAATWAAYTPTTEAPIPVFTVAHVTGRSILVLDAPAAPAPSRTLSNPNEDGAPRVFLVKSQQGDWLEVQVPVRPNGTRGWIRASDVTLSQHRWRIQVEVAANRLTVWNGRDVFLQEAVAVGTGGTPTPTGDFYVTELLKPDDPGGPYGPFAFGLSAFSDVLKTFAGGPGVIGLHGTNNSASIGRAVSHGCIRMTNASITKLAQNMPVGTPISIVP
jgi:lipoprotein-anchoring transpeptidase ErfK/SrfK